MKGFSASSTWACFLSCSCTSAGRRAKAGIRWRRISRHAAGKGWRRTRCRRSDASSGGPDSQAATASNRPAKKIRAASNVTRLSGCSVPALQVRAIGYRQDKAGLPKRRGALGGAARNAWRMR